MRLSSAVLPPSFFSSCGGMGIAATPSCNHLAHLLNSKWKPPYSLMMGWFCCTDLLFSKVFKVFLCSFLTFSSPTAMGLAITEGSALIHRFVD